MFITFINILITIIMQVMFAVLGAQFKPNSKHKQRKQGSVRGFSRRGMSLCLSTRWQHS